MKYSKPTEAMIAHAITVYSQDGHMKDDHHKRRWEAARDSLTEWGILKPARYGTRRTKS